MKLAGRVWNQLDEEDRLCLLEYCKTLKSEKIKMLESKLNWNSLMPVTQNDLLEIDFSEALGKDVQPI